MLGLTLLFFADLSKGEIYAAYKLNFTLVVHRCFVFLMLCVVHLQVGRENRHLQVCL